MTKHPEAAPDTIPETWAVGRSSRAPTKLDMAPIPLTIPSRADRRRRAWISTVVLLIVWMLGALSAFAMLWALGRLP